MKSKAQWLLALILAALNSWPAHAEQRKDIRDGVSTEAIISSKEPTRIRIERSKIVDVVGNIHSSNNCNSRAAEAAASPATATAVNHAGEFILGCDLGKGEIYIRPVGTSKKPINVFISSARATYTLLLRRADVPADTIVLIDHSIRDGSSGTGDRDVGTGRTPGYIRSLKSMLVSMASDQPAMDVRVQQMARLVPLWTEASFTMTQRFEGRGLVGEKYKLRNISREPMVLAEQEFDREDGSVLAIAIEHMNLRPNDETTVYIIRAGEEL